MHCGRKMNEAHGGLMLFQEALVLANYIGCNVLEVGSYSLKTMQLYSGEDRIWN
jgi:hypothetical protein